jgi:hypothetical protein
MLSEGQQLFLLLVLLYLSDSLAWLPRPALAFVSAGRTRWRVAHPSRYAGNARGGLVFLGPLPPIGEAFVAAGSDFSVSPAGVSNASRSSFAPEGPAPAPSAAVSFTGGGTFRREGERVFGGAALLVRRRTAAAAARIHALFEDVTSLPEPDRAARIDLHHGELLDLERLRTRLAAWRAQSLPLYVMSHVYFAVAFLAIPTIFARTGLATRWTIVLSLLLATHAATLALFWRGHRRLMPEETAERWQELIKMLLYLPAAIRACDALCLPLLDAFHPLTVAAGLLYPGEFRAFARQHLLDLANPAGPPPESEPARSIESWHRARWAAAARSFVKSLGLDPDELTRPPAGTGNPDDSYCPRCHQVFSSRPAAACPDCGGVALKTFESAAGRIST